MTIKEVENLARLHIEAALKLNSFKAELIESPEVQSSFGLIKLAEQYNSILLIITASGNLTV